jgi:hypothetical protein
MPPWETFLHYYKGLSSPSFELGSGGVIQPVMAGALHHRKQIVSFGLDIGGSLMTKRSVREVALRGHELES